MVTVEHDCDAAVENPLENGHNKIRLKASGEENTTVGPIGWCRGPRMQPSERSDALTIEFPKKNKANFEHEHNYE
jgi:hypothetical protein